jgi:hypothetical protein
MTNRSALPVKSGSQVHYDDLLADALMRLYEEGRYRVFANFERIAQLTPRGLAFAERLVTW